MDDREVKCIDFTSHFILQEYKIRFNYFNIQIRKD